MEARLAFSCEQCIRVAPNYHQNKAKMNRSKIELISSIFVISIGCCRNDRRAPLVQTRSARSSDAEIVGAHTCYEKAKCFQIRHVLITRFENGFDGSNRNRIWWKHSPIVAGWSIDIFHLRITFLRTFSVAHDPNLSLGRDCSAHRAWSFHKVSKFCDGFYTTEGNRSESNLLLDMRT